MKIASWFDSKPQSDHFGILRTKELVSHDFYWPEIESSVQKYVLACEISNPIKAARLKYYGKNIPILLSNKSFNKLTENFITNLPKSNPECKYAGILVIVEQIIH